MSDHIPNDILINVLSRLPPKSLIRYTCVCKSWYSLITSPNFISTHLNQTITNTTKYNNHLLFIKHYNQYIDTGRYALYFENQWLDEYTEFECPFRTSSEHLRIVGCCSGLICLSDDYDYHTENIIIWNPSISKSATLPKPQFNHVPQWVFHLGFGFDHVGNDYKVVKIVYLPEGRNYKVPPHVEIYSLSTGTWRSICDVSPHYVIDKRYSLSSFLNGALHWVASGESGENNRGSFISASDMGSELFREIMMPDSLSSTEELKLSVLVMGTSIAVVQYQKIRQSDYCWIWVMKEYGVLESWTRVIKIDMRDGISQVIGFRKNGEVLVSGRSLGLMSYDPEMEKFSCGGIHGSNRSFYACAFTESLVFYSREKIDTYVRRREYDMVNNKRGLSHFCFCD